MSTISFFEFYRAAMPMFVPSVRLLRSWVVEQVRATGGLRLAILPSLSTNCFPPPIQKAPRRFVTLWANGSLTERRPPTLGYEPRSLPLEKSKAARAGGWLSWVNGCKGDWRRAASTRLGNELLSCYTAHTGTDMKVPKPNTLSLRARCAHRYATLAAAQHACGEQSWCAGVTKDGGMRCEIIDD